MENSDKVCLTLKNGTVIDKKCKILVTGSHGQLGQELFDVCAFNGFDKSIAKFYDRKTLDITDYENVLNVFNKEYERNTITFVVNCAAYTNVEKAETDIKGAWDVNVVGVRNLCKACKKHDFILIHISTDYVTPGCTNTPLKPYLFLESRPLNEYGLTKKIGEEIIHRYYEENSLIIRTSWVYSMKFGSNFYLKMFNRMKETIDGEKEPIKVVNDQIGSPTNAHDLADFIINHVIYETLLNGCFYGGIQNFANNGCCSWYDFTVAIRNKYFPDKGIVVKPIKSSEFETMAKRPSYSVLDVSGTERKYNIEIPHWSERI